MITPLHALLVAEAPALSVRDSLRRVGYDPRARFAATPEAFGAALMQRPWDIVIARYGLPGLSVWDVLGSLQRQQVRPPFVVIADGLEEEEVVRLVAAGVTDVIRSADLGRLGVAVAKAIQPAAGRSGGQPSDANASDSAFHDLAEHMPIGLYRSTQDGRILYANPALAQILGRVSVGELLGGQVVSTLTYPRQKFVEQMEKDGAVHNLEACWQRSSGEAICTRENTRAVRDENGDLLYYEGTMEDITDERRALHNERHRVEQLEAIVRFSAAVDAAQSGEELHGAILRAVEETLHADAAVLVQREDGGYEIRAWSEAISEEDVKLCTQAEVWSSYPVHTQPLLLRDEHATESSGLSEPLRAFLRQAGLRALGSFPLLYRGEAVGMIVAFYREAHTFTEGELRIAETLAWHVAVALSRWQAECELRDSETSLRTIAETTGHVLYRRRTGAEDFDYITASIQKLTGYTETELEALGGLDALVEACDVGAQPDVARDEQNDSNSALYRLRHRDGELRWVEDCVEPWIDETGATVGVVGILQDVTARRKRERGASEAQRRSLAQQKTLVELASLRDRTSEAVIRQATERAAEHLDADRVGVWLVDRDAEVMECFDLFERADAAHATAEAIPLERLQALLDELEESRGLAITDAHDDERVGRIVTREYIESRGVRALLQAPIRRQGRIAGVVSIHVTSGPRDWTTAEQNFAATVADLVALNVERDRRAEAEQALRKSELRYRAISELAADYAYSLRVSEDGHTAFEWATKAFERISGYTPAELSDVHGLLHLVHPDDRAQVEDELRGLVAGRTVNLEVRIRTKAGEERWVSNRSRPVLDADGRIVQVYSSGQDITEQKAFERELIVARDQAEEMARLKSAFLANMSHEIRTPLTGILGFAGVLLEEVDADHREFVQLIEKSGRRLLDTLNSVLDLAQLESDGIRIDAGPLDVVDEIEQVVRLLTPLAEEKGLVLELDTVAGEAIAPLDSACFNRILHNLVGNALKFTKAGTVRVVVRPEGRRLYIQVEDTGIGIDGQFLPHLFDEFKQESTGQGRSHEGSGLGLAITRKLVELMGGTITVESEKGEGSTFTIYFPRIVPSFPVGGDGHDVGEPEPSLVLPVSDSAEMEDAEVEDAMPDEGDPDPLALETPAPQALAETATAPEQEAPQVEEEVERAEEEPELVAAEVPSETPDVEELEGLGNEVASEPSANAEMGTDTEPDDAGRWWMEDEPETEEALDAPNTVLDEADADAKRPSAVLVVEDNDETRRLIERVLREAYDVEAVADARTALQRMAERPFDALVLDINLGGKQTGVDILRVARAIPGYDAVVAVALTAYALPGDSERFLDAGFDRYVSKPFTKQGLMAAISAGRREPSTRIQ